MIELPILDSSETSEDASGPQFWRSYPQLQDDPAARQLARNEFMPEASEAPGGANRRQFLQLMGASMALAGLTACRRPVKEILPYAQKPEEIIPGIPLYYATAMPFRGVVHGLLVESHEGRPTKVEGNPQHPGSQGATSLFDQASILNLYDPDRSGRVRRDGAEVAWQDFVRFSQQFAAGGGGRRLAVLAAPSSSPTVAALRRSLEQRYPQLRWVNYEPEGSDPVALGMQLAFGRPLRPAYHFSEADVIVSLDGDFLSPTDRNVIANTREFARSRRLETTEDGMSRLYVVESAYSLTGGMADHRVRLRASDIPAFAAALAARLGAGSSGQGAALADHPMVATIAADLQAAGGRGVVLAGETQPPAVHALCMAINGALGSIGQAVRLYDTGETNREAQELALAGLVDAMKAGSVDALLMIDVNPVYSAPAALDFAAAMQRVEQTVHLGLHLDETAQVSRWHVPMTHFLEAWGDGRAYDGTRSIIQPLIAPLYDDAVSEIELLSLFAGGIERSGYDLVRETWRGELSGDFEKSWRQVLHDGFLPDSGYPEVTAAPSAAPLQSPSATAEELEVVFRLDPSLLDGRYSNNAWMQELPDPTTKLVWDNVALMSKATAEQLGLSVHYSEGKFYADLVELALAGGTVTLPVWVQPGLPDGSITVVFGYGRNLISARPPRKARFFDTMAYTDVYAGGPIANGVGANVAPLRSAAMERVAIGAAARKVGDGYMLASTQEHGSMEGRPIVRMQTLEGYREDPFFALGAVPPLQNAEPWEKYPALWEENHPSDQPAAEDSLYRPNAWGMVIDLNTCTGCNACVIACTSENNIQVVGKEEVSRGREMYWLRVDRYFVSDAESADEAQMVVQPVPCMHCENAPCESVCPVAATVHSPDGLNEMVYNRCIGTRYCSNNCPYKVRRYNFFNWAESMPVQVQMLQNPNVTVRFRGVMEKCTYCVQRIRETQRRANIENRGVRDGEVQTACQQVCPADAITFGDLNDPTSAVSQQKKNDRRYEMLAELAVKPRTSYLGRVTNPNPSLA